MAPAWHPAHCLTQEVCRVARPARTGHQHVSRSAATAATGDSPAARCSCDGALPPCPVQVSQTVESRSMVNGPSAGPAPADQARASSSRLTRSCRTCPHRKLRSPSPYSPTRAVPPQRSASALCNPGQRRCHEGQYLVSRMRPTRGIPQVAQPVAPDLVDGRG